MQNENEPQEEHKKENVQHELMDKYCYKMKVKKVKEKVEGMDGLEVRKTVRYRRLFNFGFFDSHLMVLSLETQRQPFFALGSVLNNDENHTGELEFSYKFLKKCRYVISLCTYVCVC